MPTASIRLSLAKVAAAIPAECKVNRRLRDRSDRLRRLGEREGDPQMSERVASDFSQ
jgi:hypothetical protein